jgi:predicted DNA-binding protein
VSNTAKRGRKKLSDSEKMKQVSVSLDPEEKSILMLWAYRYQLTLSKLLRVLLINAIDIEYKHATVMTPTDPNQYFALWGQRLIVQLGYYYEAMVRFGYRDEKELESLVYVQTYLPFTRREELQKELENIRSGTLKFNVPSALHESIRYEAKSGNINMSEYIRKIIRNYIEDEKTFQLFIEPLSEAQRARIKIPSREELQEKILKTILELGRQASTELATLALMGVKAGQELLPTQMIKKQPDESTE